MFFEHKNLSAYVVHHYCPNWKKFHRTFLVLNTKTKLKYSLDHVNIYLLTYQFFGCFYGSFWGPIACLIKIPICSLLCITLCGYEKRYSIFFFRPVCDRPSLFLLFLKTYNLSSPTSGISSAAQKNMGPRSHIEK